MLKQFISCILLSVCCIGLIGSGALRAEEKPSSININTKEEIEDIIEGLNGYIVSRNLGFSFDCFNPESPSPVVSYYTGMSRSRCLYGMKNRVEWMARSISIQWENDTGSKKVDVYDVEKELLFRIDNKGEFVTIGSMM